MYLYCVEYKFSFAVACMYNPLQSDIQFSVWSCTKIDLSHLSHGSIVVRH